MRTERRNYQETIARRRNQYGDKFDDSELNRNFIRAYESQERITVDFGDGMCKRGTIGITTGWKPVFLLMLTKRSLGSSWTIGKNDREGGCKPTR